jgi:hypothetical protein
MNPKKKSRRCLGLGLNSGLDLAISRFTNSLGFYDVPTYILLFNKRQCFCVDFVNNL